MRRFKALLLLLTVSALVVASAVPAGAAKAEKAEYLVAECLAGYASPADRIWFTGHDDKVVHIRGNAPVYDEFLLIGGTWEKIGTNTVNANGNGALVPWFEGQSWGTFSLRTEGPIGDFDGSWSWAEGAPTGRGSGTDADGRLLKVTVGVDAPIPSSLPAPWLCQMVEFLVIDPHA
ncbi:MAG: hypothetical protein ABFR53_08680 [Actinomycetota bacterium]